MSSRESESLIPAPQPPPLLSSPSEWPMPAKEIFKSPFDSHSDSVPPASASHSLPIKIWVLLQRIPTSSSITHGFHLNSCFLGLCDCSLDPNSRLPTGPPPLGSYF
ncbi:hypothetical protein C1H46_017206 [Malus baccata]|uniref:Uncharacterized protein n=1 Tax=Malus baccata TaxID=106549 RepID=A0A540MEE3_MALBA|nr:hypothetical protein C1H46_017206 [Malus baccata]